MPDLMAQYPVFLGKGRKPRPTPSPSPTSSGAYPDASNTGVPAGTSLTTYSAGNIFTSSNGQIIENLHITNGSVVVQHNNVIVRKCLIDGWSIFGVDVDAAATGCLIEDCHIDGRLSEYTCINARSASSSVNTIRRCRLQGSENGVHFGSHTLMEDSFIHDLFNSVATATHADGAEFDGGMTDFVARHNTIIGTGLPDDPITSCLIMDGPNQSNFLVENNVFAGANWTVYGPGTGSTSCIIQNNKFWAFLYGPTASGSTGSATSTAASTWTGNQLGAFGGYDSTNKLIQGSWTQTGTVP